MDPLLGRHAVVLVFLGSAACGGTDTNPGSTVPNSGGAPGISGSGGEPPSATGGVPTGSGGAPGMGTGGASSVGSGGRDPNVTFVWPEADLDAAQLCQPGHYVGTFECTVTSAAGMFPIAGPVDLRLEQGQSGELLEVSGGSLTTGTGVILATATILGTLDCLTGEFDGQVANGSGAIPPFPPGGNFDGVMPATFSPTGPTLAGTWSLVGTGGAFLGYSCMGPWTATWQGP